MLEKSQEYHRKRLILTPAFVYRAPLMFSALAVLNPLKKPWLPSHYLPAKLQPQCVGFVSQVWGEFSFTWQGFLLGGGEKIPDSAPWTSALKLTVCPEYAV